VAPRSSSHERYSFANLTEHLEIPNLIDVQRESFKWFMSEGLAETFADISPITDYSGDLRLELQFDPNDEDYRRRVSRKGNDIRNTSVRARHFLKPSNR